MRTFSKYLLPLTAGISLALSGSAAAWNNSFSFGDSFNPGTGGTSWGTPNWNYYNQRNRSAWGGPGYYAPPGNYYYPRVSPYDRTMMKDRRQRQMSSHESAMDSLSDMLYGRFRFNRQEAIDYARQIELGSDQELLRSFHPGAIATAGSHTAPTFWGNEETFKANLAALKTAAGALAEELKKRPSAKEGALYPHRVKGFHYRPPHNQDVEPVSREIFTKYNELANTCQSCHRFFRIPD